ENEIYRQAAERLASAVGLRVRLGEELLTIRHGVTHHRIAMVCFEARRRGGAFRSDYYVAGRWLPPDELQKFPVSVPQRKLAEFLVKRRHSAT
ncbi:MAG: hypothetical protein JNM56_38585, partial [Planctomycetia bacterium]|nr:hypothetical protein [Planctomycetia bacterium]